MSRITKDQAYRSYNIDKWEDGSDNGNYRRKSNMHIFNMEDLTDLKENYDNEI